jgi:hypothetical protein
MRSASASFSTHSATVRAPSAAPMRTIDSTISRSSAESSNARTNEPSILSH